MANSVTITGYKEGSSSNSTAKIGEYKLQLNPSDLKFTVGQKEGKKTEDVEANGGIISSKAPISLQRELDLSFTIDNTGVVPNDPDVKGYSSSGGDIVNSIKTLEEITVEPVASTHRPPFVRIVWGKGSVSIYGIVKTFSYVYTFFDSYGVPLRATVNMQIQDLGGGDNSLFQSPDITKMPIVKDGDTIVKLSEEYYDNKKYYIKLAEFNNLSSLRNLKHGSLLEVPPIR